MEENFNKMCEFILEKSFVSQNLNSVHPSESVFEEPFKCNICEKTFAYNSSLKQHQKRKHQLFINKEKQIFETSSNLNETLQEKSAEHWFECKVCHEKFQQHCALIIHTRAIHAHEKLYQCQYCDKMFAKKSTLIIHKTKHTGERSFSCNVCFKTFTRKSTLQIHMRYHVGFNYFKCEFCEESFNRKSLLVIHKRDVHGNEKPYVCHICHRSFSLETSLNRHLEMNSCQDSYECEICQKTYNSKSSLVRHGKSHLIDATAFPCVTCGQYFSSQLSLSRHKKLHILRLMNMSNGKFICQLCHKTFTLRSSLTRHKKKLHGIKPSHQRKLLNDSSDKDIYFSASNSEDTTSFSNSEDTTFDFNTQVQLGSKEIKSAEINKEKKSQEKFECEFCDKSFLLKSSLSLHKKRHKQQPTPERKLYGCKCCLRTFKCIESLKWHKMHDCSQTFNYSNTRETPDCDIKLQKTHFKCIFCPKNYPLKASVLQHVRSAHAEKLFLNVIYA